jgi:hypothetical protein
MIRDTSRTNPNILRILPEPILVLSYLFSGVSNESKTILSALSFGEPLSMFPYGSRICRHDRDTSLVNGHQGVLENNNDPHAFYEDVIIIRTSTPCPIPFITSILALVRDVIIGNVIPSSISLPGRPFNSFPCDSILMT